MHRAVFFFYIALCDWLIDKTLKSRINTQSYARENQYTAMAQSRAQRRAQRAPAIGRDSGRVFDDMAVAWNVKTVALY